MLRSRISDYCHLRYFVTVVEEGGFTRAAARLHLAQPGLRWTRSSGSLCSTGPTGR
ncbi:LysR family transcriptional regulator [Streptomyces sp. NPDC057116]|uniref:LysR family transcriptional regulator n=1 Tax=Streptomyces sp. NPDC057116 TaxID=3346023 RepID=UPI003644CE6C